jgi:DNA repair photolyase
MMKNNNPFVSDNFICDSSLHLDDIVEQTTSWLTVNPIIGCPLDCAYCFRKKWQASSQPIQRYTVMESIHALVKHKLFVPDMTPISANVSSTDALLPQVKESTFRIIKWLDQKGYKNIFGIISKLKLSEHDLKFITSLKNIRIVLLVSYAEIPSNIEPIPIKPRIENLKKLKEADIPTILYFRPIVSGWNDSIKKIIKVLSIGEQYTSAIAIGGLRLSKEIIRSLATKGVSTHNYKEVFYPKIISTEIENNILKIHRRYDLSVPIFKHTSCAVSYIFNMPNYNHLYKNPELNCMILCPPDQRECCQSDKVTNWNKKWSCCLIRQISY